MASLYDLMRMSAGTYRDDMLREQQAQQQAQQSQQLSSLAAQLFPNMVPPQPQSEMVMPGRNTAPVANTNTPSPATSAGQATMGASPRSGSLPAVGGASDDPMSMWKRRIYQMMASGNPDAQNRALGLMNNIMSSELSAAQGPSAATSLARERFEYQKQQDAKEMAEKLRKGNEKNAKAGQILNTMEGYLEGDEGIISDFEKPLTGVKDVDRLATGAFNWAKNLVKGDDRLVNFLSLSKGATTVIGKGIMNESGNMSNQDAKYIQSLMPDPLGVADSPEVQREKMRRLKALANLAESGNLDRETLYMVGSGEMPPELDETDMVNINNIFDEQPQSQPVESGLPAGFKWE